MKRRFAVALILSFFLGGVVLHTVIEDIYSKSPPAFDIMRNGDVVGYADIRPETSEIVTIRNARSPGLFIAFPIFAKRGEIK